MAKQRLLNNLFAIKGKLFWTLFIILLFRLGSFIPSPYVNYTNVQACVTQSQTGTNSLYDLINLFSGGALLQLSIFALGVMPYITASIILQLLKVVIPHFDKLHKQGQIGQAKLTQYTRYITLGLALLQSTTLVTVARSGALFSSCSVSVLYDEGWLSSLMIIITMTAGTVVIMWFGELITEKGVGNGMSLLIFTSISAQLPNSLATVFGSTGLTVFLLVCLMLLLLIVIMVFVELCYRAIYIHYAKRSSSFYAPKDDLSYLPVKINMAGVVPVIFASSILYLPPLLAQFSGASDSGDVPGWVTFVSNYLTSGSHPLYWFCYFFLIIGFTFFYIAVTFNAEERSDELLKYNGYIPGVRAGKDTTYYFKYVLNRLTSVGSLYLAIISLIPLIFLAVYGLSQTFAFGGTSLLIIVGVGMETVRQIRSNIDKFSYKEIL